MLYTINKRYVLKFDVDILSPNFSQANIQRNSAAPILQRRNRSITYSRISSKSNQILASLSFRVTYQLYELTREFSCPSLSFA